MSKDNAIEQAFHTELSRLVTSMKSLSIALENIVDEIEDICMNSDCPEAMELKKLATDVLSKFQK